MNLEEAIEEIKKMFWGVLKGEYNPDEEENVKAHLITNLATLTSFAKSFLPLEQQEEYENHFNKAKEILLKFDSAGPWFRELPEMTDTVYNVITHANMLQIEYQRSISVDNDALQFLNAKLESLELSFHSLNEEVKKLKIKISDFSTDDTINVDFKQKVEEPEEAVEEDKLEKEIDSVESEEILEDVTSEIEVFDEEIEEESKDEQIVEEELENDRKEDIIIKEKEVVSSDTKDLIEGIELASQYEFEQEPFIQSLESEQESLKKLANLLTALDPGDDSVISPLTEKLMTLGDDDTLQHEQEVVIDEGFTDEELEEVHAFRNSVSRLGSVLSSPDDEEEDAATFVSSIKKTIAHVSEGKDIEPEEKSPLTKMIEAETGETEKLPVQSDDIQNIITHLESKRQKALERIQHLEQALNSEKIDEEEWQELRIKAEKHVLRIEDTLDGYRRYMRKLK